MSEASTSPRRSAAVSSVLAALVACVVLLPLLGHKPLAEWDEGIYAEVSREMLHGSWLVPHWNGLPWLEKPPLMLWITAAFFRLFGVSEFWARAGSALSGVAVVVLLHGFLARTRDLLTAWLSTVILLTTIGFLRVAHVGEMDAMLSLGACIAIIGLCQLQAGERTGWYVFWAGFAIAVMTKGAAAATIPITVILVAITQRWPRKQFGFSFLAGLLLFYALTLPWHIAIYLRFGHEFSAQYLGLHVLTRATQQIEGHHTHWWYYVVVLLVSAPPFVLLYPLAVYRGLRRRDLQPWAVFAIVTIVFFTLIQTRLPHYVAPVYPALAVLTAVWLSDWLRSQASQPRSFWIRAGLVAALVWAASILLTRPALMRLRAAGPADAGLHDNREADALLKAGSLPAVSGPLLYLRDGRVQSIATVVFYARRPVQLVLLSPAPIVSPLDPYKFSPELLADAVTGEPRLILLDKSLIPALPSAFTYRAIRSSATEELGTIARAAR